MQALYGETGTGGLEVRSPEAAMSVAYHGSRFVLLVARSIGFIPGLD